MSGVLRGTVFGVAANTIDVWGKDAFYSVARFFDNHPGYQRIASYYGKNGLGFDSSTGSYPSGYNRWGVWRKTSGDVWDIWIGFTEGSSSPFPSTTDPSGSWNVQSPTDVNGGLGFIAAWNNSGVAWNGSHLNNGKDQFVTTAMWKSGCIIFPTVNSKCGLYAPSQSIAIRGADSATLASTGSIVADDDNIAINFTATLGSEKGSIYFNKYTPASGSFTLPYFCFAQNSDNGELSNYVIGSYASTTNPLGGCSVKKNDGFSISGLTGSYGFTLFAPAEYQNRNFTAVFPPSLSTVELYETPLAVFIQDYKKQYVGTTNFIRTVNSTLPLGTRFGSGSRITIFNATNNYTSIPWSSSFGAINSAFFTSSFYTGSAILLSSASYGHISQSSLRDIVGGAVTPQTLYRGYLGGAFYYGVTNPPVPGAVDVTVVRKREV